VSTIVIVDCEACNVHSAAAAAAIGAGEVPPLNRPSPYAMMHAHANESFDGQ
jgi:hypothetical protein